VIAAVTVVLAVVSYFQWQLGRDQLELTRQALIEAGTPHIRVWMDGRFEKGMKLYAAAHVKNVGNITIFGAKVSTAIAFSPAGKDQTIWQGLEYVDEAVIGPEDVEDYILAPLQPTPAEIEIIKAHNGFLMAGAKIEFRDKAGRLHERYICTRWFPLANGSTGHALCDTPPQS
jgi:hypothetical protein